MHCQYGRLTEQSPLDIKETFGWLKATNLPGLQLRDCWWLLKTRLLGLGTMSTTSYIGMSVPLAACAVQAWRQSTTLWQAV